MRLLSGLLAGQSFYSVLNGDDSLRERPMQRIIDPLSQMRANIWSREGNLAPLSIKGTGLQGIKYKMPIASAQLKSSILLAGLFTDDDITLIEPAISRDHTERFLDYFGLNLVKKDNKIHLPGSQNKKLDNQDIRIPSDISTASFFIAAALMVENSKLILKNIGVNYTRSGFLDIIKEMGGNVKLLNINNDGLEPAADIKIEYSSLKGVIIEGNIIPRLIDELPIIAVLATQAEGKTIIKDAAELRVKETDRIKAIVTQLTTLGADIVELPDGMIIHGPTNLENNKVLLSYGDHRIAMSLAIACLKVDGSNQIMDTECINNSFPSFEEKLLSLFD
jgi:3-phosphoshikimate 1-carboxyvinyltransferase